MKKNLAPDCKCGVAVVCFANNDNTEKLVYGFNLRPKRKFIENIFYWSYS